jgi:trigger factor
VKATLDKTENRQAFLTIEMEPAEVEEGLKKAFNRLVQKANVPGFRKGKTPRPILEQYLGKEAFLEDAVEHMAQGAYEQAVKEKEIKPIARPEFQVEKMEPVTYKVVVALEPKIKLGDYHQIKLTPESIQLKEEDLNNAIEQIRRQHGIWEPVDRQVNSRDSVTLDIESQIGNQPYINQKDAQFEVEKESEFPMKGFSEELIGLKKGETKEFKLSFPADYGRAELAGKETSFKVTIKEIKQEKLPEVNEDLAKQVNPDFKTVEDLKNKVREGLQRNAEETAKRNFEQKVIDELVKQSEIEYPSILEEEEVDHLIRQQMQQWRTDEKGMDSYLQSIKKTPEEFREELRPVAIRNLKQTLVLTEAAQKEKIQIEKSDLESEVQNMTKDVASERKEKLIEILNMPQTQVNLASAIATRKIIERLTEIAKSPVETTEKTENAEAKPAEAEPKEAKQ